MNFQRFFLKPSTLLVAIFVLALTSQMSGQSLELGAVVFTLPVQGAYNFTLTAGGYQEQGPDQSQLNGFHYENGKFHLWKNGGPGYCFTSSNPNIPGCRFDGEMGKPVSSSLSPTCEQISFPITDGILQILHGNGELEVQRNLIALYSQTFCDINGSAFMSGGALVVNLN
jgi:hypothetical protein